MIEQIAILGFGNMGEALASGLVANHPSITVAVLDKSEERRNRASELGFVVYDFDTIAGFLGFCDTVVLAIKPQDLGAIAEYAPAFNRTDLLSILAGTTIASLTELLKPRFVARLMPSLAARVGRAAVGLSLPPNAPSRLRDSAFEVARAMGTAYELPERLMSAMTGLSGSGLAYVFAFIHALALGGTRAGIPYAQAVVIAREVTAGAAELLASDNEHPIEALSRVISPAGTTIEGVAALEQGGFSAAVIEAVVAAADRATELEG
jgi:pyrroline-5-carboxylate reductase